MNPMLRPVQMKLIVSTLTFKKDIILSSSVDQGGSIWSSMIQMEFSNINGSSEWWTWKGCWTRWRYINIMGNITNTNSNKHKTTPPHFWPGRVVLGQICLQTLNSYLRFSRGWAFKVLPSANPRPMWPDHASGKKIRQKSFSFSSITFSSSSSVPYPLPYPNPSLFTPLSTSSQDE